jgi:hypothetical protein
VENGPDIQFEQEGNGMAEQKGNQTPNTPDVSETELREMKVDELRQEAKDAGVGATSGMRKGPEMSDSLKYSQEVTSPDDEPEREGRSLVTTSHEVIKAWAEERDATPATVEGTEHGDHLGVLRFDFGGDDANLRHVSWDEWFNTFDVRRLNFIYQEQRSDGRQSNFFQFDNPEREDA